MEGESYSNDLKRRGRRGRKEEKVLENPEDISIQASEDETFSNEEEDENRGMSTRGRSSSIQNKPSNAKGERKQSNAKGERKPSNPKGERKQSNAKGERKPSHAKGQRKTEITEIEDDQEEEDQICEVCYSGVSQPFLNEEMKSLFDFIRCQKCDMSVHKICYGYKTCQDSNTFLCDECTEGVEDAKCDICGVQEGCLRFVKKDQWVHSLCGITNATINYKNVSNMEIDLHDFKKDAQKVPATKKCIECENKVETLPIENQDAQYCHLHCALMTNVSSENQKSHWDVKFSLKNEESFHAYRHFDEKKLVSHIEGIQLKIKDIVQKSAISNETDSHNLEIKEKKARAKKEESLAVSLETIKELARQSYEETNTVEEGLKVIGGKISLFLEKNKKQKKSKKTTEMEVESQGNNYSDEELTNILISLNKEIINPLDVLEIYSQNKLSKLRSDLPEFPTLENLSFPELLFFVVVFQIRAEAALNNLSAVKDLCRLANSAKLLPFNLSSFLKIINEKFYLSIATDLLAKPWIALCSPKSAYNPTEKKFSNEIMTRNSEAMITCQQILDLYTKKSCGVITSEFETGMQYHQNLSFLQEFYNNISGLFDKDSRNRSSSPDKNKTPNKGSLLIFSDDLPQVHLSLIMELSVKRSALGFIDDQLEELKLLDTFNKRSTVTLNVDSFFRSGEKSSSSSKKSRLSDSCSKSANSSPIKGTELKGLAGKLSLGKAVIHSPIKVESPKSARGRPEGLASLNKKVEELYKEKGIQNNEKEPLANAEKRLKQLIKTKNLSKDNKETDPEVASLLSKINAVKAWMVDFTEAEKKKKVLEEFLEIEGLEFRVNEMAKALNYERKWLLWRNTAQNFTSQLRYKGSPQEQDHSNKLNVKNLEGIVREGEELKFIRKDDGLLAGLNEKLALVKQIQTAVKEHNCTLEKLQELESNLNHINLQFPEADKLKLKVKLLKEADRLSRDTVTLSELEEFSKLFTDHVDLIGNYQKQMEIRNKLEQANNIQNKAKEKLPISIDSDLFEAQEMAQLAKHTRESRMIIDQVQEIENELSRVLSLWNAFACLTQDRIPVIEQLENAEFDRLEGKSLKQILQDCEELLAGKILTLPEERINILKDLCHQTHLPENHKSEFHQKLHKFFECLDGAILTGCIDKVANTMEIEESQPQEDDLLSKDEKIQFIEKATSIAVLNLSNQIYFDMLDQLGLQVGAIFNEMFELAEAKAQKINRIYAKVEPLSNEEFPDQVKMNIMTIKQLKQRSDWIYKVAANKQARGLTGWRYSDLKFFVEKFEELGIPSSFSICRELQEMLKIGETMKQSYETRYGKARREVLEGKKKEPKFFTEDVAQILSFLEGQVCLEDEINEIGEDVNKVSAWTKSIENTVQGFIDSLEDNTFEGFCESLKDKYDKFSKTKLALKDRKGMKWLEILRLLGDAEEIMTAKTDLFELSTFQKIRQDCEGCMKDGLNLEKLVDKINEQVTCANLIIETANQLKEVDKDAKDPGYNYETLMEFLSYIASCKVELKEERQYFDDIAQKSRLLAEGVEMMKKEGAPRMSINELQRKVIDMGDVPIVWEEELIFLQQAKSKATKALEAYKEFEKNKTFESLKKVAESYTNSLLHHEKAQECQQTYAQVIKNQEILKARAEEIHAFSMSYEELEDLREKVNLVATFIREDWVQELKPKIFFKLSKTLQNPATDLSQISSEQIYSRIQECNSMNPQDDQTKEALEILQETLPKVLAIEKQREEEIQRQREEEIQRQREEEIQRQKESEAAQAQFEDDYPPEPAIEPELSDISISEARPQYKVTDLEEYLIKEQESKKVVEPFVPKTEEEHQYVGAIKKMLTLSEDIRVSDLQLTTYARSIIATFPEVLDSLEAFARVTGRLKTLLKYPLITKRLVRRNFDSNYLSKLIRKEEVDLKSYEKRLRDQDNLMNSDEKGLAPHETLTKKLKREGQEVTPFSPSRGFENDSPPISPDKRGENQNTTASPNPFSACHIDKLSRTDSGKRRNPLRKLLKGEDVSDFLNEEDSRNFSNYGDSQEYDFNRGDQDAFSENEDEKKYEGVQPESEIKYDKNLLAKPLKASVGKGQRKPTETILYDPDNPNAEPILEKINDSNENHRDPRKRLRPINAASDKLPDFKKIPPGSILRIFDGVLRQGDSNKGPKAELFTCDPYDVVNSLPQIVKEGHASLRMTGRFSLSKFQAYFNKCLNNFATSKNKEEVVVSGWIESHVEMYQRDLDEISADLDSTNKVIMIGYNESSRIYVLTSKQFNPQWRRLLGFRFKKVQKDSRPYLHFIIIHKPYKLAHDTVSLVPDPVPEFGGNNPIFDLNSLHNFEIIKKRPRKIESDEASLLLEQNADDNYTMGGDDLWGQEPIISQPTIPRTNKLYSPNVKSVNTKRGWEEIQSDKKNNGLGTIGEPTKKVKSEVGFVKKYLDVDEEKTERKKLEHRKFEEEPFFQQEEFSQEEPVGELDVMVKKMAKMDQADLIRILEDMEEQDIVELATKMDQKMRDNVISILQDLNKTQSQVRTKKIPKRSTTYQPPQHIKAFYQLFTPEQMNLAQRRVNSGYQIPVKVESFIQTIPDEEDFGAIITETRDFRNQKNSNKRPAQNNQNSGPIQLTEKTIQMPKQIFELLSQIQNAPMQRVISFNNQPNVPAVQTQTTNKIFLNNNKFIGNKENQGFGNSAKFNQGTKFSFQKNSSMKLFNHNKRVNFNN